MYIISLLLKEIMSAVSLGKVNDRISYVLRGRLCIISFVNLPTPTKLQSEEG